MSIQSGSELIIFAIGITAYCVRRAHLEFDAWRAKIDRAGFLAEQARSETGIGASGASGH